MKLNDENLMKKNPHLNSLWDPPPADVGSDEKKKVNYSSEIFNQYQTYNRYKCYDLPH